MKDAPPDSWDTQTPYAERSKWHEDAMPSIYDAPMNKIQHEILSLFFPKSNVGQTIQDLAAMFGTKYAQMTVYLRTLQALNLIEEDRRDMSGYTYRRVQNPWNRSFHARVTNFYQRKEESIPIAGGCSN